MALEDYGPYNPTGYDPKKLRPIPPPADVPRGGMPVPPHAPLSDRPLFPGDERDNVPETYADPLSPTRSMRYGLGDERDLSVPVIDPRTPLAPSPATWSGVVPRGSGRAAYSTNGGYAYTNAPAVPDETTPRVPFADAAGESLAATAARGARMQAEQDRLGLTTADMDYIRTYGRAAYDARQAKYGQPTTREDYLRQQQGNLAASVAARRAAENELSRIERDNEAQRRRQMWAAEQETRLKLAQSVPVSFGGGAGVVPDGNGGWTAIQPPAPEARPTPPPTPVGFGAGAGAIPETDENGNLTWRESRPQAPLYSTTPRGEVYNNQTGDITHEVTTAGQDKNGRKRFVVKGRLVDEQGNVLFDGQPTQTEQALARKYAERQAAIRANAGMLDPQTLKDIDAEIAALEAKLEEEHATPDAPGGASSPSEPPAPAAAAPAPTPAPAPAAAPAAPASTAPGGRVPIQTAPAPAKPAAPADPWAAFGGLYTGK